jgi:long-chain acyl-CoA synthetase
MAHAFGPRSAILSIIYCGSCIYFFNKPPSPKVLMSALQQVRPTILGAVPLVFEKIYHKQVMPIIAKSAVLRLLSKTAATKRLLYKIVGKKVYQALGGRLRCVIIGGAPFHPRWRRSWKQGGIPTLRYGLSGEARWSPFLPCAIKRWDPRARRHRYADQD